MFVCIWRLCRSARGTYGRHLRAAFGVVSSKIAVCNKGQLVPAA
jgi:hypothetical protein